MSSGWYGAGAKKMGGAIRTWDALEWWSNIQGLGTPVNRPPDTRPCCGRSVFVTSSPYRVRLQRRSGLRASSLPGEAICGQNGGISQTVPLHPPVTDARDGVYPLIHAEVCFVEIEG